MYYDHWEMNQHFQQLFEYLQTQQEKINQLEMTIQNLQSELNNLKQNQSSHIDKIEYKFDQLKVETLEGTLNIGITPNTNEDSTIEDFAVTQNKGNMNEQNPKYSQLAQNIQNHIHDYLNHECYTVLQTLETKYAYSLDDTYRQFIIEDIKKQINNRIQYYLNQCDIQNRNDQELENIEKMTINKVKEDIHNTCEEFIKNLPRKEY